MGDCSSSVTKYIVVEASQSGGGSFSGLTVCGGDGLTVDFITGCTSNGVNVEGGVFSNGTLTIPTINTITISGGTYYGDGSNLIGVGDNYMTGGTYNNGFITFSGNGSFSDVSVDVSLLVNNPFTGNTSGSCITDLYISNIYGCSPITIHDDLLPNVDGTLNLGTPSKRFRDVNTVSGTSSYWVSTTAQITTLSASTVNLGLDSSSELRILNANTIILRNDFLDNGIY